MATRVLIADKLPPAARTRLQSAGFEVQADASLKDESLLEALKGFQPAALIVRSTKVTAAHVEAASELQLVVRAGAGVNTIDLDAASSRGVYVSNCPGMNAVAVAELAWGHIINADRQIADNVSDLRQGQWRKKTYGKAGRGLKGRTLGVVGCGAIGKAVIARALAFEMDVFAWSPSLTPKKAKRLGVRYADDAVEVARQADVLTVHVALTPATRGFIGEAIFEAMRPGSILINTTRGEVLDEAALARAVREKGIRAGLDVFCGEPSSDGEWRTPSPTCPGYGTHHIAASTLQAQEAVADEACRVVEQWQSTGQAPNCVNLARVTPATHMLVVRHADEVGVLAHVLGALSAAQINVQQMENIIFSGDEGAACARVQVEGHPGETLVSEIKGHPHVLDVGVVEI